MYIIIIIIIYIVIGKVSSNEAINMDYYIFEFPFILWEKKAVGLIKNKLVKGCMGGPAKQNKKRFAAMLSPVLPRRVFDFGNTHWFQFLRYITIGELAIPGFWGIFKKNQN
jgi:hypothetical protein